MQNIHFVKIISLLKPSNFSIIYKIPLLITARNKAKFHILALEGVLFEECFIVHRFGYPKPTELIHDNISTLVSLKSEIHIDYPLCVVLKLCISS